MKYIKYILIIVFPLILLAQGCIKEECKINGSEYQFVLNFTLSPAQETYHIGDTITISSTIKNPVYERVTGNYYVLEDFKFYLKTIIFFLDTTIDAYHNLDYFDIIIDTAYDEEIVRFSDGTSILHSQYLYESSQKEYNLTFKIIPKRKGHFIFTQYSDIWRVGNDQWFEGKCNNVDNDVVVYTNNRLENNFNLINECNESVIEFWNRLKESRYLDMGGYCFKVID